jgi:hypothetical protein
LKKLTAVVTMLVMLTMMPSVSAWAQEGCQAQYVPGEFIVQLETGEFESWVSPDFPDIEDPEALAAEMWAWADWIETLEGVSQADPDILQCLA